MFNFLNLKSGVGEGEENREEDVKSLSKSLGDLGDNAVQNDGWSKNGFVSKPLFDGVKRLQDQKGVKVDGIVRPRGETEQIVNNSLAEKPQGAGLFDNLPGPLSDSVGAGGVNRSADVSSVKRSLGALGHIAEDPFDQPNGFMTAKTDQAIRQFQRGKGLKEDGLLYAHGPTKKSLDGAVTRLSDEERAKWKRFHDQVAVFNQTQARPLFPQQESDGDEGVVPAKGLMRRGTGAGVPGARPGYRPSRPLRRDDFIWTHKGPVPNIFKGLEGLFGGSQKPEPGRKPTKLPPAIMKGPDPSQKRDDYRGTSKPATPPKLPEKKAPGNLDDIRKGAIEILPDKRSEWSRPWIVEHRYGGDDVRAMNAKLADITREVGEAVFGSKFLQIGGPRPGNRKEYYLDNPDTRKARPRTTKGYAFIDISYRIEVPRRGRRPRVVFVHIDTYTARKDGHRDNREQKQHEKLHYNNHKNALVISIPKPRKNEELDYGEWRTFIFNFLKEVRKGIEAGDFDDPARAKLVEERFATMLTKRK